MVFQFFSYLVVWWFGGLVGSNDYDNRIPKQTTKDPNNQIAKKTKQQNLDLFPLIRNFGHEKCQTDWRFV